MVITKYYPLTQPQKRIWYMEKIYPGTSLYNIGGSIIMRGTVDLGVLEAAIHGFIQRNEGIRLCLTEVDGEVYQYIGGIRQEKLDFFDFSIQCNPEESFREWVDKEAQTPFALENNQLYYFALFKISDQVMGYFVKFHHIIADGWSMNIMTDEISNIYLNLIHGNDVEHLENESYIKFIAIEKDYLTSNRFYKDQAFWMEKYKDLSNLQLYGYSEQIRGKRQTFRLDEGLSKKIKGFAAENKVSLNTFFVAIYMLYLYKIAHEKDIVIGTPVLNRSGRAEKKMFGMFTSSMPFRYAIKEHLTVRETMKDCNDALMTCYFHQKYPYNMLVQDLELKKRGYDNLFNTCINYYNTRLVTDLDGATLENIELYNGYQVYSLQIVIKDWLDSGQLTLDYDYKSSEFSDQEIQTVYKVMSDLIKNVIGNPDERISQIQLLSAEQRQYFIYGFNSTDAEYPRDKTIHRLFEEQVERTPDKAAVSFENNTLTFRELNKRANQLAAKLEQMGVRKESVVGLLATHSIETVVGILAVLKAGGAYLPIDVAMPPERICFMLSDSGSEHLLTNVKTDGLLSFSGRIVHLNQESLYSGNYDNPCTDAGPDNLAYVIYTSGSSGNPKGTLVEHKGLVNYIWWARKIYVKNDQEVFALYSSLAFDLTVTSIFTPLVSGSLMRIYEDNGDEYVLYRILKENKATIIKLTPSHLSLLKDMDNRSSSVKRFIVGGEDLKVSLAHKIFSSFNGNIEIYNEYGPTETVVGCMIHRYHEREDTGGSVPIGTPADNLQIYVLDENMNPVPANVAGEIYISGDGVARGYLNNPALTGKKFIMNPFVPGKRMYKTGDWARFLDSGSIEYLGRRDEQIKIRGFRVETGEIEKQLTSHEAVRDAVVIARERENGARHLYAYIVKDKEISMEALKNSLAENLPDYMIPSFFIEMKSIPLTHNGKVNKALLPLSEPELPDKKVPLSDEMKKVLVPIIEDILGIDGIGAEDHFYALGGDSIKAIQIAFRLSSRGMKIKVRDILTHPVIKDMAGCIRQEKQEPGNLQSCSGVIRHTPIVKWFLEQNFQRPEFYNQSVLLDLKHPISIGDLEEAICELVCRHDSLRINYDRQTNELFYNDKHIGQPIPVKEYFLDVSEDEGGMERLCEGIKSAFDLKTSLLFRASLIHIVGKGQCLLLTAHHLVVDGVSWRVILEDLHTGLLQLHSGKRICLSNKTDSFQKWAQWVCTYAKPSDDEVEYWKRVSSFDARLDFYHENSGQGRLVSCQLCLKPEETQNLLTIANQAYKTQTIHLLVAALVLSLKNFTKARQVAVELESHGREELGADLDIMGTVGWFTCIYPAVFQLDDQDMGNHIKSIKEHIRNIPANGMGYGILKYLTGQVENRQKYVRFNYLGEFSDFADNEIFKLSGYRHGRDSSPENRMTSLLDIDCLVTGNLLKVQFTYEYGSIGEDTVRTLSAGFIEKLTEVIYHCMNKKETDFTPSDFDTVSLSQNELDSLFL